MTILINFLCQILQCNSNNLEEALKDPKNRYLASHRILTTGYLRTIHLKKNLQIKFSEISYFPANKQYAYRGYGGIMVEEHMLNKHGIQLKFPNLPCIMEKCNKGHVNYFPIELLEFRKCKTLNISTKMSINFSNN